MTETITNYSQTEETFITKSILTRNSNTHKGNKGNKK